MVRDDPTQSGDPVGAGDGADCVLAGGPPPALVAGVAGSLMTAVAQARTPLAAELVLCEVLGMLATGIEGDDDDLAAAVLELLGTVTEHCALVGTADALAVLRVCAVLGPDATRAVAGAAADGLAGAGVPDRPWAARLGRPAPLRAWRYGDVFGTQSSVGVMFDDQGREHALMVLIDENLGGGIKDAWVAQGREAKGLRNRIATGLATEPDAYFEDIDLPTAAEVLREALACLPCPEQDDQIEDVATYLFLVRSRTEHLARPFSAR